jgi:hypothetical protein
VSTGGRKPAARTAVVQASVNTLAKKLNANYVRAAGMRLKLTHQASVSTENSKVNAESVSVPTYADMVSSGANV